MGASMSAGSGAMRIKDVDFREEYARWRLESVKKAYMRWQGLANPHGYTPWPPLNVNRRQFFEIFTDDSDFVDGAFLSLPMRHFDVFAKPVAERVDGGAAAGDPNHVFVMEVFYILVLVCSGSLADKLHMCFTIFDFNKVGHLTLAGMVMMLQTIALASTKMGVIGSMPETEHLETVAAEGLHVADANSNGRVEEDEFLSWAKRNVVSQDVLGRFNELSAAARPSTSTKRRRHSAVRKNATALGILGKGRRRKDAAAGAGNGGGAAGGAAESGGSGRARSGGGTGDPTATRRRGSRAKSTAAAASKARRRGSGTGAATDESAPAADDEEDKIFDKVELDRQARVIRLRSVANHRVLHSLVEMTHFSRAELLALADEFSGRSDVDLCIDEETFRDILRKHLPAMANSDFLATRVYQVCDTDLTGGIDFQEFALGLSMAMRGSLDEKTAFLFRLLDIDGSGQVEVSELATIVKHCGRDMADLLSYAEEVMRSFDVDGSGQIDADEFTQAVAKDPALMDTFHEAIRVPRPTALALHALASEFPEQVTYDKVVKFEASFDDNRRVLFDAVTADSFMDYAAQMFALDLKHGMVRRMLFEAYEGLSTGLIARVVTTRDVLNAFTQVLTTSRDEQVKMFFKLFDLDGNGELDNNEVLFMILSAKTAVSEGASEVIAMLEALDRDGDGSVTLDEFMERAFRVPIVVQALHTLFGVSRESDVGAQPASGVASRARKAVPLDGSSTAASPGFTSLMDRRRRRLSHDPHGALNNLRERRAKRLAAKEAGTGTLTLPSGLVVQQGSATRRRPSLPGVGSSRGLLTGTARAGDLSGDAAPPAALRGRRGSVSQEEMEARKLEAADKARKLSALTRPKSRSGSDADKGVDGKESRRRSRPSLAAIEGTTSLPSPARPGSRSGGGRSAAARPGSRNGARAASGKADARAPSRGTGALPKL